jgi:fused signal recognition particle receptor
VLGIVDEHKIPVRYVGIGERVEDLRVFDASSFVDALFDKSNEDVSE